MELAAGFLTLGGLLILYFLPSIVASQRNHKNKSPIQIINFFFGWTLIGWVICLAWASSS